MYKIYCVSIDKFNNTDFAKDVFDNMSNYRKDKYLQIKSASSKAECMAGSYLLNHALMPYNLREADLYYTFGKNKKPYISNIEDFYFNISHSGQYAILSVSDNEIGCDIQKTGNIKQNIAKRFFSQVENEFLNSFDNDRKEKEFFRLWSIKEAYLKYTGDGLSKELSSFSVIYKDNIPSISDDANVKIREYSNIPGYFISVISNSFTNNDDSFYFI